MEHVHWLETIECIGIIQFFNKHCAKKVVPRGPIKSINFQPFEANKRKLYGTPEYSIFSIGMQLRFTQSNPIFGQT